MDNMDALVGFVVTNFDKAVALVAAVVFGLLVFLGAPRNLLDRIRSCIKEGREIFVYITKGSTGLKAEQMELEKLKVELEREKLKLQEEKMNFTLATLKKIDEVLWLQTDKEIEDDK